MVLSLSPLWVESLYPYSYPYLIVLSLSPFWVESLCSYPYIYYSHISLIPFWGRVATLLSIFISILYGLVFKSFLGRVTMFISICIYYSNISLSPFERTSLCLAYLQKIYIHL